MAETERLVLSRTGVATRGGEVLIALYAEGNLLVATIRDPAGNVWQRG